MDYLINNNITLFIYTGNYLDTDYILYGTGKIIATDFLSPIEAGEIIISNFISSSKKVGALSVNFSIVF